MKAVIETGGKQFSVKNGDQLIVDKLDGEKGSKIQIDKVLLIEGDSLTLGAPYIEGAKVEATIVNQEKAKKIIVYKYKRRKGYHKKQGHRQQVTRIKIDNIVA